MTHSETLETTYQEVIQSKISQETLSSLPSDVRASLEFIVQHSENNKALVTVLMTLLVHKIVSPTQDIRFHQAQLPNGFTGRNIDKLYVTPFMKEKGFPAMSESGWLTRSFEQPHPYDLNYPGKITPQKMKDAFLFIVDQVQCQDISAQNIIRYYLWLLIQQRDNSDLELAKPHSLSISNIVKILEKHFNYPYSCAGASRLPTLAIYAAYQCMFGEVARYQGKTLCPLESHNSADIQSGRIGDIDINNENGTAFEGVEVKHKIVITRQLVIDSYEKFKIYNTDRYYLLTTASMENADWKGIDEEIERISRIHGCQVIVNGVYSSIKYYLRLIKDPAEFIDYYVELLKNDKTIKYPHKKAWNDIIAEGI